MAGIKETEEVIAALGALSKAVILALKDGFQPVDALDLIKKAVDEDSDLGAKLLAAFVGIAAVPSELGDLDLWEIVKLGKAIGEEV